MTESRGQGSEERKQRSEKMEVGMVNEEGGMNKQRA